MTTNTITEQYRPRTWSEVVAQDKAIGQIQTVLKRGWGGRAWWISGPSGTGKTTLARILASEGADKFNVQELDSQWLTPNRIREIQATSRMYGLDMGSGNTGRAYIVNESHCLSLQAVNQLLTALEDMPDHVVWIFTTTADCRAGLFAESHVTSPLLSRCVEIKLAERGLSNAFAEHVKEIAMAEGLDGKPLIRYQRLAQDLRNNCRAMLQAVEKGEMAE